MTKRKFTENEQLILRANPYTSYVNADMIKFAVAFKELVIEKTTKQGMTFPQVLREAGYDPDMLGKIRIDGILKNIKTEAASPAGLHDTGPSKESILKKDLAKKRTETSIRCLQEHIAYLEQEIEFLKKVYQLPRGSDRKQ